MTLPTAIVSVEIKKLRNVPAAVTAGGFPLFARAIIGWRHLGRSRAIPAGASDFDLTAEPQPWKHEVTVTGNAVTLMLEVWEDRGDDANQRKVWIQGSIPSPYVGGTLVFGSAPEIECVVSSRIVPPPVRLVVAPRSPQNAPVQALVAVPNTLLVEITNVRGLYQPGFAPVGVAAPKRSEPSPGYTSDDELGRIFLNRDLAGDYVRDTQQIELAARVTVRRGQLPADAKLKWVVADPHDPFNGEPGVHRQWAAYIDPGDYDAAGASTGARDGDNEGKPDKSPAWEQVAGFPLSVVSATEAKTDIVSFESKVVLHCPNVAGDNLVVRAEIESATPVEVFEARTGLMTMWHRLDVQYIRMTTALPLPVADIPGYFEQACAELNFAPETVVADQQFMAPDSDALSAAAAAYVSANFTKGKGWFCLVSAREPHPLPAVPGGNVYTGPVTLNTGGSGADKAQYIEIPGDHPDADFAELSWGANKVGFKVFSPQKFKKGGAWFTRLWLYGHDVTPSFTAGDGSWKHAYASRLNFHAQGRLVGAAWTPPGYGAPASVQAVVSLPGAFYTAGISPPLTAGGKKYFAGRTIVFSHHGAYYRAGAERPGAAEKMGATIAHELVHAFGMPHKCGYYDYQNPRQKTCHMNYSPNWMMDAAQQLIPGSSNHIGSNMCGRHLKEVRRVHLEDNVALKSIGW